jgi:hypothetical protein
MNDDPMATRIKKKQQLTQDQDPALQFNNQQQMPPTGSVIPLDNDQAQNLGPIIDNDLTKMAQVPVPTGQGQGAARFASFFNRENFSIKDNDYLLILVIFSLVIIATMPQFYGLFRSSFPSLVAYGTVDYPTALGSVVVAIFCSIIFLATKIFMK